MVESDTKVCQRSRKNPRAFEGGVLEAHHTH
jgi:hypothetical protein